MTISLRSILLVTLQFILILSLGLSAKIIPASAWGWILVCGGLVIGGWAVFEMRHSKLRVQPEVAPGAVLITTGPYRFIRNPMYLSVLLVTFGWLFDRLTIWRASLWFVLIIVLVIKINYEETFLNKVFPKFRNYAFTTKKLIPFIW
jgi:protein-S-isoprenylcysteine O-methyltransferase Ste14